MTGCKLLQKAELPLEVVILLIAGMTMLIAGALLFPVSAGLLPYHENGLYGLLLVMFALQIITLGKTPFGDMRRSKFLLAAGVAIASAGIVTGVIPDLSSRIPRLLLFLCFGPGGLALLLQMFYDKGKLRAWVTYGGIFRHLIFGCAAVYGFSLLIALLLWQQSLLTTSQTAAAVLAYGVAIVYLACVLASIYGRYPAKEQPGGGDAALSTEHALLLLMSVFMMLLGGVFILGLLYVGQKQQERIFGELIRHLVFDRDTGLPNKEVMLKSYPENEPFLLVIVQIQNFRELTSLFGYDMSERILMSSATAVEEI